MTIDNRTDAERIADNLGNDGSRVPFDPPFEDLAIRTHYAFDYKRHVFRDGSAIVVAHETIWDLEHPDCLCGFCLAGGDRAYCDAIEVRRSPEGQLEIPPDSEPENFEQLVAADGLEIVERSPLTGWEPWTELVRANASDDDDERLYFTR